jgi:hypothetical protein
MSLVRYRSLDAHDRALVAIAVLVDGNEAATYLECDAKRGADLKESAQELCKLDMDARLAFVGTALRLALEEGA